MRRKAVATQRHRVSTVFNSSALTWNGRTGRPGDQDRRSPGPRVQVSVTKRRRRGQRPGRTSTVTVAPVSASTLGGGDEPRLRLETGGRRGDGPCTPAVTPPIISSAPCVGAVTGSRPSAGRRAPLAFGQGLQVGKHLARVELVGQRIDHRGAGRGCHRGERFWAKVRHTIASTTRPTPVRCHRRFVAAEWVARPSTTTTHDGPPELGDADLEENRVRVEFLSKIRDPS